MFTSGTLRCDAFEMCTSFFVFTKITVGQSQSNVDISVMDSEIKGAVVEKFLTARTDTSGDDCFTSSDTVNELLKGFSDERSQNASLEDATQILPSFSKVLSSYFKGWFCSCIFHNIRF